MSSCPRSLLVSSFVMVLCACALSSAQVSHREQVQIAPPLLQQINPPDKGDTVAQLEERGDQLRMTKLYLDALDYYREALSKEPNSSRLLNKIGIAQLQMQHYREAKKSFEQSIKTNRDFADAYNNLGVVYYEDRRYSAAVKQYRRAIAIDASSASFFSNLGAALFSKKEFDAAVQAYQRAIQIDPEVFMRSSRGGVQAQLPSPEDRARYNYTVAKLYAKMGLSDQSLEYLRKAMEEGYKDFNNVYKDAEFADLRKDKRFTELVSTKMPTLRD